MGRLIKNVFDGRTETFSHIMKHARKPVFVDNAVHYVKINKSETNNLTYDADKYYQEIQVMPDTTFRIVEGQSFVEILYKGGDGHSSTAVPFFNTDIISSTNMPSILYNSNIPSERLLPSTVDGNKINLTNMKNKSLSDIGFSNNEVRLGQPIDVGFRTTDLAIRLGEKVTNSNITSFNISKVNSKKSEDRKHSTRFVAKDFNKINIMTALRFLGRHDTRMAMLDRFGNMLYVPISFSESSRYVDPNLKTGSGSSDKVQNIPNRITVQGKPLALNDSVIVTLDDTERQSGLNGEVIEGDVLFDATVNTSMAARRVGRQILRANSLESGTITSEGHIDLNDVRPGMAINYGGTQHVITEVIHHPLKKSADLVLLTIDTGLEGVLQGINEGITMEGNETNPNNLIQNLKENITMFGRIQIRTIVRVSQRLVSTTAFLIGGVKGNNTRGLIGKSGLPIGMNKSQEAEGEY